MIKRKFLGFLAVLTLGLGFGFSNSSWIGYGVAGQVFTNPQFESVDLSVLRNGSLLSQVLGVGRPLFTIDNGDGTFNAFYWGKDGLMNGYSSCYNYSDSEQCNGVGGPLEYFYICDLVNVNTGFSSFSNCDRYDYTGYNVQIVNYALNYITAGNMIYYGDNSYSSNKAPFLGINISDYGHLLLFYFKGEATSYYCGIDGLPCPRGSFGINRTISASYNYGTFPDGYLGSSPVSSNNGYNPGISAGEGSYVPVSGNVVGTTNKCTQKKALDWYRAQGLTDSICYSYFQTMTGLAGYEPGLTYADIWFETMDLRWKGDVRSNMNEEDWFKFRRAGYKSYKYGQHSYNDIFANIPNALPGYFSRLYNNWDYVDTSWILEYCQYAVYTPSQINTTLYQGVNFSSVCRVSGGGLIDQPTGPSYGSGGSGGSGSGGSSGGGSVDPGGGAGGGGGSSRGDDYGGSYSDDNIISIDWGGFIGDTTQSGEVLDLQSSKSFISNFYNTVKENLQKPNKNDFGLGILPDYIIFALLGLIFFRFLSH